MVTKDYWLEFGSGDPRNFTGLSPTFIIFSAGGLTALAAPPIAELPTGSGFYKFSYGMTVFGATVAVVALGDGGVALSASDRYVSAVLDPVASVDQRVGTPADTFGSTTIDPTTVVGYVKRIVEWLEGNAVFTKSNGLWDVYSRGSSTLLREKVLTNTITSATKS